jgi:hypothetical protein
MADGRPAGKRVPSGGYDITDVQDPYNCAVKLVKSYPSDAGTSSGWYVTLQSVNQQNVTVYAVCANAS